MVPRRSARPAAGPPSSAVPVSTTKSSSAASCRLSAGVSRFVLEENSLRARLDHRYGDLARHHASEAAALHQLLAFAAAAGDFVLRRADRLLAAARGLDRQQIAIARRHDRAYDLVVG